MNVTIKVMTDSLDCYLNYGPRAPVTFGDERSKTVAEPHVIDSKIMKRLLIPSLLFLLAIAVSAQNRMTYSVVSHDSGHVALGLAIRKLNVSGTFMQAPAHPDDETNALFALFTHGMGLRSIDVQNNRGEGGQNEIGPELFRDIGVLRTSELLSAHRIDGAEQYFTRAIDYGYSFDPQEVIDKWGREEIVGDYVRLHPHAPARRAPDDEHPGTRRRSRARSDDRARARGVSRGRRPGDVSRSRFAKACARGSRRSCISPRRRRDRRRGRGGAAVRRAGSRLAGSRCRQPAPQPPKRHAA